MLRANFCKMTGVKYPAPACLWIIRYHGRVLLYVRP
uniref:Uncharacterized protein n=1 Tax=Arundo donax TaxID=35708 RepID=A0A0A9BQ03_ARUDO